VPTKWALPSVSSDATSARPCDLFRRSRRNIIKRPRRQFPHPATSVLRCVAAEVG